MGDSKVTVRSVERALDILLCFADESSLSMSEIAQRVALHKSTVHRLLASLETKGFVIRDPVTDHYRLGFRVWELSANLNQADDPASVLLPEMERLRDHIGETISLYIRHGHERIRIQAVQSNHPIRRVAPIGVSLPLYVGASSKVLLAFASPQLTDEIIQRPDWPSNIDEQQYRQQLSNIRACGFATSMEEREAGAAAVAVPIFNRQQELIAALSISGPANRLTYEEMERVVGIIKEAAHRMGMMLRAR